MSDCMARGRCERGADCPNAVEVEGSGLEARWFISMGHPGFNSPANNRGGYVTRAKAQAACRRYDRAGQRARAASPAAVVERLAGSLGFETLEVRKSDREDFRSVAVWQVRAALEAAYEAGRVSR